MSLMSLNEYQARAAGTALPVDDPVAYNIIALAGEAGELAGKLSKTMRDPGRGLDPLDTARELGDVLWHLSEAARAIGWSLDALAQENLSKLYSRSIRGMLTGDGDDR